MKRVAYGLLFVILGMGLLLASVAVLVEASLVKVSLNRNADKVTGSVEYCYYGVPIYWVPLRDLQSVEKREIQLSDGSEEGAKSKRDRILARVVFLDSQDQVLAWGERVGLLNAFDPIQRFLASKEGQFEYEEKPIGHPWDIVRERIVRGFFALTLVVGGVICLIGGGRHFWLLVTALRKK